MQCGPVHEPQRPTYQYEWKDTQSLLTREKREWKKVQEQLAYEKHAWEDFTQNQVRAFDSNKNPVCYGHGCPFVPAAGLEAVNSRVEVSRFG
jgi:hypothetical protein